MIGQCVQQRNVTEDTDSGSPAVDVGQVKDHLMKVFGHLLQKDELMKSKTCSVAISRTFVNPHHPSMHSCLSCSGVLPLQLIVRCIILTHLGLLLISSVLYLSSVCEFSLPLEIKSDLLCHWYGDGLVTPTVCLSSPKLPNTEF